MSPRLFFLALLFLSGVVAPSLLAAQRFVRSQLLMGNITVTLTVDAAKSRKADAYRSMEKAFDEARRLENEISEWRPESDTTRLNQNAGKPPIPIGADLMALLVKAREISGETDGAFDITFASKKKNVSYRDMILHPESGRAALRRGVTIGVSSIAKGAIVDRMSGILKRAGFRKFLVNAGDLYANGSWTVGLRDPSRPGGLESLCEITVRNRAVSTSGQYERGPHIIDPKTGKPASSGLKSVTVIADSSTAASPLATGFFVLGAAKAKEVVEVHPDISAVFVQNEGKIDTKNVNPRDTVRCRPF